MGEIICKRIICLWTPDRFATQKEAFAQLGHPVMWFNILSFVLASMLVKTRAAKRFALWFALPPLSLSFPVVPIDTLDGDGNVITVNVQKSYYINIVFQLQYGEEVRYHHFRITMTRDGVLHIVEIKKNTKFAELT